MNNCLVLVQYREESRTNNYNDLIGILYHFPGSENKSYLKQFKNLPLEFIYYEPTKNGGKGEYFGYGKIVDPPFKDKQNEGQYFVKIDSYKAFTKPVSYKKNKNEHWESDNPSYNAQNSVRSIPKGLLDEICLEGEIKLNFQVDAHLIKVLGEQLIGSEKVGILVLIKNAYDAGASECNVYIENSKSLPALEGNNEYKFVDYEGPVIVIEDNGSGMSKDVIENGWLRPASTLKTNIKEKIKKEREDAIIRGTLGNYNALIKNLKDANNGRLPLGEKGVGRFATHRLGKYLTIKTKVASLDYEYVLSIDWDKFDSINDMCTNIDSIGINIKRQTPSRDYGTRNSGTQVIIYGGREGYSWTEEKIRDLNDSIIQLNSPCPNPHFTHPEFIANLIVPQIPDLTNEDIISSFNPTFEFVGIVDENGELDYELTFKSNPDVPIPENTKKEKYNLLNSEVWQNQGKRPSCGPFFMHLKLWYRKSPWISGPDANHFLKYLDQYGGISIYRDAINIFPAEWGAENDWLKLSKAHIKQGWRFSYYNMIGNVEISQDNNINITDKTNREGLIENKAYCDLRDLIRIILETILMNEWVGKRDLYNNLTKKIIRSPKQLKEYTQKVISVNSNIQEKYPVTEDPYEILDVLGKSPEEKRTGLVNLSKSLKDLKESIEIMEEVQDMLTEQAGFGLAIASSLHEINKITSNFYNGISKILKSESYDKQKLESLSDASLSLKSELKRLGPLRAIKAEKRRKFNIIEPINYMLSVQERDLKKYNIQCEILGETDGFDIYARYGAVIQIFTNLMSNAIYWLNTKDSNSKKVLIKIDNKHKTIIFADDGPGIHSSILPHLFKPGYSMKIPRSGLGLYISQYYVNEMKGSINNISNDKYRVENMQGAQFFIDLSKTPVEYYG